MESQTFVKKSWGWERWFANTARYCGKHLFIEYGKWSSNGAFHYHKLKDETFYVISGSLVLDFEEKENKIKRIVLSQYDSFRVHKDTRHRFTAADQEGCHFIEASTTHRDSDSYRVDYNEETKTWKER